MSFDKDRVLADVNAALEAMPIPGSPGNPVAAGWVSRVIAQGGQVHLVLALPQDLGPNREPFKKAIEERLLEIDDVNSVQVLEQQQKAQPQAAAGEGPVFGAQGVPGVKHIIAVASGKGGVGKSTVAVNLAVALAQEGHRTGLLDSDVYGPSIPKMMGLEDARPRATEDDRILPIERHGVSCMSLGFMLEDDSPVIWRGPMVTGLLKQFLFQVVWGELDYLILDLPPGTGDAQLTLVQSVALSGGVIVTTPQDVALLDVQRGIQMFRRVEVPILGVVENMSAFKCPSCGTESQIFSGAGGEAAAKRYEVPFLGSIPLEPEYALAGDSGAPIAATHAEAILTQRMTALAKKIGTAFN